MNTYSAYKTASSIDWNHAIPLTDFSSPWTTLPVPPMTFRALWNQTDFLFRFEVTDDGLYVFSALNHKMEVVHSDRVEIFFRRNDKMDPYYCLEMDPVGRVLDYKTHYYRKFEYDWEWPGQGSLQVTSTLLPHGYRVEGRISLQSLRDLGLLQDGVLEAGLFRGKCLGTGPNAAFNWITWITPDAADPDFHIPSSFGSIQLIN